MNIMEHVTEQYPTLFKFKEWVYQRDYNKSIFFKYKYYDAYGNIKKAQQVFVKVISTSLEEHLQELEDEVSRQIKEMC